MWPCFPSCQSPSRRDTEIHRLTRRNREGPPCISVHRAIACVLVTAGQLQIVSVIPEVSTATLWSSPLSEDTSLRRSNPLVVHGSKEPAAVKELVARVAACRR
ncbi:DUF6002 family protein [Streptomyces decoyicus]|uniref:DUF6002 family protein n=1 Tax=Streptomyces decoyicus TaxID=249567 RepID=UPI00364D1FBB